MTDLDLTEAIDAAWERLTGGTESVPRSEVRLSLEAAAPFIAEQVERLVRERIANDIRDMPDRHDNVTGPRRLGYEWARADAIYIARGGAA